MFRTSEPPMPGVSTASEAPLRMVMAPVPTMVPPVQNEVPPSVRSPVPPRIPDDIVSPPVSTAGPSNDSTPASTTNGSALVRLATVTPPAPIVTTGFAAGRSITTWSPSLGTIPSLQLAESSQNPSASEIQVRVVVRSGRTQAENSDVLLDELVAVA